MYRFLISTPVLDPYFNPKQPWIYHPSFFPRLQRSRHRIPKDPGGTQGLKASRPAHSADLSQRSMESTCKYPLHPWKWQQISHGLEPFWRIFTLSQRFQDTLKCYCDRFWITSTFSSNKMLRSQLLVLLLLRHAEAQIPVISRDLSAM